MAAGEGPPSPRRPRARLQLRRAPGPVGPPWRSSAFTGTLRRHPALEVRLSPIAGYGVFASEDISAGSLLEDCLALGTEPDGPGTCDYAFEIEVADEGLRIVVPLGYGALYNHSNDPNVDWVFHPEVFVFTFFTLRDVIAGEELCFDYGEPYWETRPELTRR